MEEAHGSGKDAAAWFKPKKGSVIPAKRRLVKRMMLNYLVVCLSSLVYAAEHRRCCKEKSPVALPPNQDSALRNRKEKNQVVPYPARHL